MRLNTGTFIFAFLYSNYKYYHKPENIKTIATKQTIITTIRK